MSTTGTGFIVSRVEVHTTIVDDVVVASGKTEFFRSDDTENVLFATVSRRASYGNADELQNHKEAVAKVLSDLATDMATDEISREIIQQQQERHKADVLEKQRQSAANARAALARKRGTDGNKKRRSPKRDSMVAGKDIQSQPVEAHAAASGTIITDSYQLSRVDSIPRKLPSIPSPTR